MTKRKVTAAVKQRKTNKPPVGRPFVKGQSGNPKGRPRTGLAAAEIVRAIGDETVGKVTRLEAIIRRMFKAAEAGSVSAVAVLLDRGWGKATLPIDMQYAAKQTLMIKVIETEGKKQLPSLAEGQARVVPDAPRKLPDPANAAIETPPVLREASSPGAWRVARLERADRDAFSEQVASQEGMGSVKELCSNMVGQMIRLGESTAKPEDILGSFPTREAAEACAREWLQAAVAAWQDKER